MRLYINQVCCGSYACLNAIKDSAIDLSLFEISTSAPFGIRHCENAKFDRLLTTFRDPNKGMDEALNLWGYHVTTDSYTSAVNAVQALRARLLERNTVVLGPIDLGGLGYQALPSLFERMDHYIVLEACSASEALCTDSEGFWQYRVSYDHLQQWISVEKVPEADGKILIRLIEKEKDFDLKTVLWISLLRAARNLYQAEKDGQGSMAIYECCTFLERNDIFRWQLPFSYDLEYFLQRKRLFQQLLSMLLGNGLLRPRQARSIQSILSSQGNLLGNVYRALRWEKRFVQKSLRKVGRLEEKLAKEIACFQ